jgi:ribosomal protein S18 acetylase RimI-like enzyme
MSYLDYFDAGESAFVPSMIESERFGLSIARVTLNNWDDYSKVFLDNLSISNYDLVILRTKHQLPNLTQMINEFTPIAAGELEYWSTDVDPKFVSSISSLSYFPAEACLDEFMFVVSDSFQDYKNHYMYNPLLKGYSAREAYVDWGRSRAVSTENDKFAGVLKLNDIPVGAVSGVRVGNDLEIELAGIHSSFQGRGLYAHLIGEFWKSIETKPISRLIISTQAENLKVQSAWKKMNLTKEFGVHTTHIVRRSRLAKLP